MSTETALSRVTEKAEYGYKNKEILLSDSLDSEHTFNKTSLESIVQVSRKQVSTEHALTRWIKSQVVDGYHSPSPSAIPQRQPEVGRSIVYSNNSLKFLIHTDAAGLEAEAFASSYSISIHPHSR